MSRSRAARTTGTIRLATSPSSMIAKIFLLIRMNYLRQEISLHDHGITEGSVVRA
jgi:hypothetical protein